MQNRTSFRGRPDFGFSPNRFRGGNRGGGNRGGNFGQRGHPGNRGGHGPKQQQQQQQQPNTKRDTPKSPSVTKKPEPAKKETPPVAVIDITTADSRPSNGGTTPKQQKTPQQVQQNPAKQERENQQRQTPQRHTPNQNQRQTQNNPRQRAGGNEQPAVSAEDEGFDSSLIIGDLQLDKSKEEKKFTGRCRLFIGNLPAETTEDEFHKMFEKFGEINEVFLNKQRGFGFIRLDTRLNAEAAKNELDGAMYKSRIIRVRVAAHGAALKVKNLSPVVSNELLEEAFSLFGEVERAVVIVDDRGKPTGEGIVEFARKPAAQQAISKVKQGVFLLTASTRPISVEPLEQKNEDDGMPEKNIPKTPQFHNEREVPPRFAQRNSFEYEWGNRWKQLAEEEEAKRAQLEQNIKEARDKMMEEIELARHDYHTMQMRQELLHRQEELKRLEDQRKEIEQRRQDLNRQREERIGGRMGGMGGMGGGMGMEEGGMPQRSSEMMRGRGEGINMPRGIQPEDMSMRDNPDQFMSGGGSGNRGSSGGLPPPPLPPPLLMDGASSKGMMGQSSPDMPSRKSRFDQPAPGGFDGASRGNMGGAGANASSTGGNFGAVAGNAGNPRPLMEKMRGDGDLMDHGDSRRDGFPQKRPRRY